MTSLSWHSGSSLRSEGGGARDLVHFHSMSNTAVHEIIQGGDDVLHPLNSEVLVPGYNTPDKLTTFA